MCVHPYLCQISTQSPVWSVETTSGTKIYRNSTGPARIWGNAPFPSRLPLRDPTDIESSCFLTKPSLNPQRDTRRKSCSPLTFRQVRRIKKKTHGGHCYCRPTTVKTQRRLRFKGCLIAHTTHAHIHTHTRGVMQLSRYEKVRGAIVEDYITELQQHSSEGKLRARPAV